MTCEEYEEILLDARISSAGVGWFPGVSVSSLAESHAQSCSKCAAKLAEIRNLSSQLDRFRIATSSVGANSAIEAKLLSEFRRQTATPRRLPAKQLWPRTGWAGLAVAFAIMCGWLYLSLPHSQSRAAEKATRKAATSNSTTVDPVATNPLRTGDTDNRTSQAGTNETQSKQVRLRAVRKNVGKTEGASATSRTYLLAGDLTQGAGGNIVRITVPSSALAPFGVPVHPDQPDRQMTADVVVDSFGIVRGIWLVGSPPKAN
jgi:hypothetical protein